MDPAASMLFIIVSLIFWDMFFGHTPRRRR